MGGRSVTATTKTTINDDDDDDERTTYIIYLQQRCTHNMYKLFTLILITLVSFIKNIIINKSRVLEGFSYFFFFQKHRIENRGGFIFEIHKAQNVFIK